MPRNNYMTSVGTSMPSHGSGGGGGSHKVFVRVPTTTEGHYETKYIDVTETVNHKVHSYHVSCKSDKPSKFEGNDALGGVVLYLKNGKTDWYLNGVHCKIGYIIIKKLSNISHIYSKHGQIHGAVYKSVFGCEPDSSIVASGFAYKPNKGGWSWNSGVFNANDVNDGSGSNSWHTLCQNWDLDRIMGEIEKNALIKAIKNWINNDNQTTNIENDNIIVFSKEKKKKAKSVYVPGKTTYYYEERYVESTGCHIL